MKTQVKARNGKAVFVVLGSVMVFLLANPVWADITKQINDTVSLAFYGQINRAMMYVDDGDDSNIHFVDNDNSSSRVGTKFKAEKNGLTAGANFEFEYKSPGSDKIDLDGKDASEDSLYKRKIEAYLSGVFGMLTLGFGPTVSDGISEIDLSGTSLAGRSKVASIGGAVEFFNNDTQTLSGTTIGKAFSNMDGSQKDRVRYDSPEFKGITLSTCAISYEGEDEFEAGLGYKASVSDTKIQAGIAYVNFDAANSKDSQIHGSASALFPMGISLTVAAGSQELEASGRDNPIFYYAKVGYLTDIWSVGKSAISLDYGKYKDQKAEGDDGDTVGLQFVQTLKDWYTELYVGYRIFSLDGDTADLKDINTVLAGMRIKF